ncbi:hypothetical protein OEZ86_002412 [Tetradesmus obliquus]|nr:hypothetical protein OEZ86_002412 [Tetradesmus obliquus]
MEHRSISAIAKSASMDQAGKPSMAHDGERIINKHLASPPPAHHPMAITETMSPNKKTLNFHAGPEVQQYGHTRVGDGQPVSDVVGGKIHVRGAASDLHPQHQQHDQLVDDIHPDDKKDLLHDGTTYAHGASHESKPGLATRIKEVLPGTHEHKEKEAREGDLAVYM